MENAACLFSSMCYRAKKQIGELNGRGGVFAIILGEQESPLMLYSYDTNYLIYTYGSSMNKPAIHSYDWSDQARKDEVSFQISFGFPLWQGILGEGSLLGASYTQRSWWQLSNKKESSPFRETNYEPQIFLARLTDHEFAGWHLREIEMGFNHQSNGRPEDVAGIVCMRVLWHKKAIGRWISSRGTGCRKVHAMMTMMISAAIWAITA
ncbi:putative Phospholipase A(1) [Xenorhabdus szentirmaii DSM 16338]|uniref:Phospholipase A1 n=1 Tax=Xenorhabdus szentirmaii DSM 16338 TaxID=1427518 RepID=W1J772_9GAMM|nr:phospholipase A [Xenorhabdus szentirmaii DSM 16338]CDL85711.1 putative Phospholipase A(1) [Xenorhabdus szentirmaii DSM 16338]